LFSQWFKKSGQQLAFENLICWDDVDMVGYFALSTGITSSEDCIIRRNCDQIFYSLKTSWRTA